MSRSVKGEEDFTRWRWQPRQNRLQGKKSIPGLRGQSGPEGMACDWGAREGCDATQSDRTQGSSSLPEQDEDKKPQKEQLEWERVQHLSTPLSFPAHQHFKHPSTQQPPDLA